MRKSFVRSRPLGSPQGFRRQRSKMRAISGPVIAANASYSSRSTRFPRFASRVEPMKSTAAPQVSSDTRR